MGSSRQRTTRACRSTFPSRWLPWRRQRTENRLGKLPRELAKRGGRGGNNNEKTTVKLLSQWGACFESQPKWGERGSLILQHSINSMECSHFYSKQLFGEILLAVFLHHRETCSPNQFQCQVQAPGDWRVLLVKNILLGKVLFDDYQPAVRIQATNASLQESHKVIWKSYTLLNFDPSSLTICEVPYHPLYPNDVIATTFRTELLHPHWKVISHTRCTLTLKECFALKHLTFAQSKEMAY